MVLIVTEGPSVSRADAPPARFMPIGTRDHLFGFRTPDGTERWLDWPSLNQRTTLVALCGEGWLHRYFRGRVRVGAAAVSFGINDQVAAGFLADLCIERGEIAARRSARKPGWFARWYYRLTRRLRPRVGG